MKKGQRTLSSEAGFTLIELLIAMGIAAILLAVVGSIFYSLNRGMSGENTRVALQQGVRSAVNIMALDLRQAGLDAYGRKRFEIKSAKRSEISFSSDLNMNGVLDSNETLTYSLNTTKRELTIKDSTATDSTPQPLLSNVADLQLKYFNESDAEIPLVGSGATAEVQDTDSIRSVEILVSATERYWGNMNSENRSYRTLVRCRNVNRL